MAKNPQHGNTKGTKVPNNNRTFLQKDMIDLLKGMTGNKSLTGSEAYKALKQVIKGQKDANRARQTTGQQAIQAAKDTALGVTGQITALEAAKQAGNAVQNKESSKNLSYRQQAEKSLQEVTNVMYNNGDEGQSQTGSTTDLGSKAGG